MQRLVDDPHVYESYLGSRVSILCYKHIAVQLAIDVKCRNHHQPQKQMAFITSTL